VRVFLPLFALLVCLSAYSGALTRGTAGAEFLKIANGVRAVAMGGSYVAVADDVYSVYWNPAGIGILEAPEVAGSYVRLFDKAGGSGLFTGVYEAPKFPYAGGNSAAGLLMLSSGDFDSTDPASSVRAAVGSASDFMLFATNAARLFEGFSVGATAKFVRRSLTGADPASYQYDPMTGEQVPTRSIDYQAYGAALDVGALWESWDRVLSFGGSVQNIGVMGEFHRSASLDLTGGSEMMPLTVRLGSAFRTRLWGQGLLASVELHEYADSLEAPGISLGAEYSLVDIAFLRLGWEQMVDQPFGKGAVDVGTRTGLSSLPAPFRTGMGIRWNLSADSLIQIDYALAPFGALGTVNHAAFLFRWNIPKPRRIEAPVEPERPKPVVTIEPKQLKWKNEVKEWKVEVSDDSGRIIKTFAGTGLPPKTLDWDGTDERGKLQTGAGKFTVKLQVKDVKNKIAETGADIASMGVTARLRAVKGKPLYPEVAFSMPQVEFKEWQVEVRDQGRVVHSWKETGTPPKELRWNGRDQKTGAVVPLKMPVYNWEFVSADDQKSRGEQVLPQVDAEIRSMLLTNSVRLIGVRFRGSDTGITDVHRAVMQKAAQFMAEHPGSGLSLESYADDAGNDDDNFQLAKQRSERVLRTLVDEYGVTPSRISVRVYGRSRPAPRYTNVPEEEQRQRVDIVIHVP